MNIAIIGMGRMGQAIKRLAIQDGHEVPVEVNDFNSLENSNLKSIDVAIEFTGPEGAFKNIEFLLEKNIPVISGSTGWLDKKVEINQICSNQNGAFLYASNFSIGMNVTFLVNRYLGKLMCQFPHFSLKIQEKHHVHKKDAPSGTARSLAEGLASNYSDALERITSLREGEVVGWHEVSYASEQETILIAHNAIDREVFAEGALAAAKWIVGKRGIFSFEDIIEGKNYD